MQALHHVLRRVGAAHAAPPAPIALSDALTVRVDPGLRAVPVGGVQPVPFERHGAVARRRRQLLRLAGRGNFEAGEREHVGPRGRAVLGEGVRPVCSPAYAAAHAGTFAGPVSGWGGLTFLDLVLPNEGWATWGDWFAAAGRPDGTPRRLGFDCYTYTLEAATAGQGIALGWRNLFERSIEAGALVALGNGFVETGNVYYDVLTEKGRRKPLARRCLALLDRLP